MNINTVRLIVMVLVTYMLGLGTGVVAGVVISFKEFGKPVVVSAGALPPNAAHASGEPASPVAVASSPEATPPVAVETHPAATPAESPAATPAIVAATPLPIETSIETPIPSPSAVAVASTPKPTPSPGTLHIETVPPGDFKVSVDNTQAESVPYDITLPPGTPHWIDINGGSKYQSVHRSITLKAGETKDLTITLALKARPTPTATPAAVYYPPPPPPYYPSGGYGGQPAITGTRR